jgi:hypothetical protein
MMPLSEAIYEGSFLLKWCRGWGNAFPSTHGCVFHMATSALGKPWIHAWPWTEREILVTCLLCGRHHPFMFASATSYIMHLNDIHGSYGKAAIWPHRTLSLEDIINEVKAFEKMYGVTASLGAPSETVSVPVCPETLEHSSDQDALLAIGY